MQQTMAGRLPGLFGIELTEVERGRVEARCDIRPEFLAPNDFLHAGTVVSLADSCCGMGCFASLPEGASGFTTVELKANFIRSAEAGDGLRCLATLAHGGRPTPGWGAPPPPASGGPELGLVRSPPY